MIKSALETRIIDALEVEAVHQHIDIVDVEIVGATKAPCVRVRIDTCEGSAITLDEVTAQNAWIAAVVEELDPFSASYTLEVSSPGMARPLRRVQDIMNHIGAAVELSTTATEGRRRYSGTITAADEQEVVLSTDSGEQYRIAHAEIKKCNVKPVYDFTPLTEGN
ncbi:ribosome maturation factor RimP [Collinsella sp. zg1085]|uniref:ribosome maturation factor RimP n=1 Tax=Collinsella sp. zg1085 TaxID=2844380 RepID=UPI001C0E578B|nr:ribosome maturation factor RimP [Collinsella sp. zg1085]QWT16956.1 ribosome maturation factor RimP [Collinsella sp. zg1085]